VSTIAVATDRAAWLDHDNSATHNPADDKE